MHQKKRKIFIGFLVSLMILFLSVSGVLYSIYTQIHSGEDKQSYCIFTYSDTSNRIHNVETNVSEPGLYTIEVVAYSQSSVCVTIQGNVTLRYHENGSLIQSHDIFDTNCIPFHEDVEFTLHQYYTLNITQQGNYSIQITLSLTYRLNLYLYHDIPMQIIQQEINAYNIVPWGVVGFFVGLIGSLVCGIALREKTPISDSEIPRSSSQTSSSLSSINKASFEKLEKKESRIKG